MKTNQNILNSKLTHIMGNTGTGKTYFAKSTIDEIINTGKNVIYVSIYDDSIVDSNSLEKIFIKNEDNIKNIDITDKNLHIVFDRKNIGEVKSIRLANEFILSNIEQDKLSENIYLILDDVQTYTDDILDKVIKSKSNLVLIHQYIQQLSDDIQYQVLDNSELGIYFKMPESNIKSLKGYYKENDQKEIDSIENLNVHEYVILSKMTVEDKKAIKEIINIYFEGIKNKDIKKINLVLHDDVLFIFKSDNNFEGKEKFNLNFEKIKFISENDIIFISVNFADKTLGTKHDWASVQYTGKMTLENQEQISDKMMISLRKIDDIWKIYCVQNSSKEE